MNKRVIPKEWKCVSRTFKGLHHVMFILCILALCMGGILFFSYNFTTLPYWFLFVLRFVVIALAFYYVCKSYKTRTNLQKVAFLPNYMYIDKYRIPYYMVHSVELSEILRGRRTGILGEGDGIVLGFLFKLELEKNTQAGKTILFAMDFSTGALTPQNDYDYQRNFIDVVMQWAHDDVKPPSQYAF